MNGNNRCRSLLIEIISILLISAASGLIWNHKLLHRAWTGAAATTPPTATGTAPAAAVPLPVGLMQIKDFFDRKEAVIIDARSVADFTNGHITGAVSLPLGEAPAVLPAFKTKFAPDTMLMVYCNGYSCHDSRDLGAKLIEAGYQAVYVFEGGYPEWKDAGYPVEGKAP